MQEILQPLTLPPALIFAWVFAVGACVGSFINVVLYRLPQMMIAAEQSGLNLTWPGSHCPHCHSAIPPLHNIPLVSYLLLKGRAACCHRPISWRYPLSEASAGLIAVAVAAVLLPGSDDAGSLREVLYSLMLGWWLLAIGFLAWQHPEKTAGLSQPLIWLGLLANLQSQFTPLTQAVMLACGCYSLGWGLLLAPYLGKKLCKMGGLPVLHLTVAGLAWFGFELLKPGVLAISALGGAMLIRLGSLPLHSAKPGPGAWLIGFHWMLLGLMADAWLTWAEVY